MIQRLREAWPCPPPTTAAFYVDVCGQTEIDGKRVGLVGPLGVKVLKALPTVGRGNKINPNEWNELQTLFAGDARC